jgi:hypothetical protein
MSYKVIHYFTDLQDFNHPYNVGDTFPRVGMKVSSARLAELSSADNKQKKPLIKLVEEKAPIIEEKPVYEVKESVKYTKTDIKRMPLDDLKTLATENGVEGASDMTGGELKQVLIKKFGL